MQLDGLMQMTVRNTGDANLSVSLKGSFDEIVAMMEYINAHTCEPSLKDKVYSMAKENEGNYGLKIPLIKAYRTITGAGLKPSKDWVEKNMGEYL